MELRHLRYFVAVAEHLHFGRAALHLKMSQPPLSQQIRHLEAELGVELFIRDRRRVQLTSAGHQFLEHAQSLLNGAERATQAARSAASGQLGFLSIGHSPAADLKVLPAIIRSFREAHPNVTLTLRGLNSPALLQAVADRLLDVAILRLPCEHRGIKVEAVYAEPLVAVLPAAHPLASHERISLRSLAAERFIVFPRMSSPQHYDRIQAACQRDGGFALAAVQEAETIMTALALVAAGIGVSLQPESVIMLHREGIVCRPLVEQALRVETGIAYRNTVTNELVSSFIGIARGCAELKDDRLSCGAAGGDTPYTLRSA
ncbi:MAG: LysR family transcriptional regulator [Rubritepida sp.]|nr:LysR family transcriptional regulator [Rubritepida sp.]